VAGGTHANGTARRTRRRPARRRDPSDVAGRIHWDRLGRVVLILVVFGLLVSYISPLVDLGRTFQLSKQSTADLQRVRVENEILREKAEFLQSDTVLRREARRQGMVSEGERAYVIGGLGR
jgi:hypothetical protein